MWKEEQYKYFEREWFYCSGGCGVGLNHFFIFIYFLVKSSLKRFMMNTYIIKVSHQALMVLFDIFTYMYIYIYSLLSLPQYYYLKILEVPIIIGAVLCQSMIG